jgi:hypothetical protein
MYVCVCVCVCICVCECVRVCDTDSAMARELKSVDRSRKCCTTLATKHASLTATTGQAIRVTIWGVRVRGRGRDVPIAWARTLTVEQVDQRLQILPLVLRVDDAVCQEVHKQWAHARGV